MNLIRITDLLDDCIFWFYYFRSTKAHRGFASFYLRYKPFAISGTKKVLSVIKYLIKGEILETTDSRLGFFNKLVGSISHCRGFDEDFKDIVNQSFNYQNLFTFVGHKVLNGLLGMVK